VLRSRQSTATMSEPSIAPDLATEWYQRQILPSALNLIAPGVSACVAAKHSHPLRLRTDVNEVPSRCKRCGIFLLDGSARVRSTRFKRKRQSESFQRSLVLTCGACGYEEKFDYNAASAPSYPPAKEVRQGLRVKSIPSRNAIDAEPPTASLDYERNKPVAPLVCGSSQSTKRRAQAPGTLDGLAPTTSRITHSSPSSNISEATRILPTPTTANSLSERQLGPAEKTKSAAASKSRPKKKAGLQEMLARTKERQEQERIDKEKGSLGSGGLAAFLSGL
jgi:RNase P subunit RPR2